MIQEVYELWFARDEAREGKKITDPRAVAQIVHMHVLEWEYVHECHAIRAHLWHWLRVGSLLSKDSSKIMRLVCCQSLKIERCVKGGLTRP